MAEETPGVTNGNLPGRELSGKFATGNKLSMGKGGPKTAQQVALLRHRAIQYFTEQPELLFQILDVFRDIALDPKAEKSVRVAAGRELLSRGLGSPDLMVKVSQENEDRPTVDLDGLVEFWRTLGVPLETWPVQIREHAKRIESKVIEATKETP